MIGQAPLDANGPIELFEHKKADHLMRKSEFGEAPAAIGAGINLIGKAVGPTNQINDAFVAQLKLLL